MNYRRLKSFGFPERVNKTPYASVIEASDGKLYGTTFFGGSSNVEGPDGRLYGTTQAGGRFAQPFANTGYGTIFRLNKDGSGYCLLHHFNPASSGIIGSHGIIQSSDGNLYGFNGDEIGAGLGELFRVSLTFNHRPSLDVAIHDQPATYGSPLTYMFPANTFTDPDAGQTLSYTAAGMPLGTTFNPATRTFSGTPTADGAFAVIVTATDDGAPPLSTNGIFHLVVSPLMISVVNTGGSPQLSWPSGASGVLLEGTDDLALPVVWQPVTSGINDNGTIKSFIVPNAATLNERFYRLRRS